MTDWRALRQTVRGALSESECEELAHWAKASNSMNSLEVGHYRGLSTCVLLQSLPVNSRLTTIDHHQGDAWSGPTRLGDFIDNVTPYLGRVVLEVVDKDFRDVVGSLPSGIGFIFYDADHSRGACEEFWRLVRGKTGPRCLVLFDDADWKCQSVLRDLSESDGFTLLTRRAFARYGSDKNAAATYTIEVMGRGIDD